MNRCFFWTMLIAFIWVCLFHSGAVNAQKGVEVICELSGQDFITLDPRTIIRECNVYLDHGEKGDKNSKKLAYRARGIAHLRLGEADLAKSDFYEVCKLRPKSSEGKLLLASVFLHLHQPDEALACVRIAKELDPGNASVYSILASVLAHQGEYSAAIEAATKSIELDPKLSGAYLIRGMVYFKLENASRCLDDMIQVFQLTPDLSSTEPETAYLLRGLSLVYLNRFAEALPNLVMARQMNSKSFKGPWGLCQVYAGMGKWHLAAYWSEEAIRIKNDFPDSYVVCATAKLKTGKISDAKRLVTKGLELSGDEPVLNACFGEILQDLGDYKKAMSLFDKALESSPDCTRALVAKASLLATCPDAEFRDGTLALKLALSSHNQAGVPEWLKWSTSMAVAEAYAECGNFAEALKFGKKSLVIAGPEFGQRQAFLEKLAQFEKCRPYRINAAK